MSNNKFKENISSIQDQQYMANAFATGLQYHQTGDFPKAEKIYQQILQKNPNQPEVLHQLGLLYYQVGKYDFGVKLIKKAIAQNPSVPSYYSNLGIVLRAKGDIDAAIQSYQEALRLNPDFVAPHLNLGVALQKQGKLDKAIKHYREAIRLKPDYAEAHSNISVVLQKQGRLDEAIDHCREALRLKPDFADAYHNMGNALKDQGKFNEAIRYFHEALRLNPHHAEAHNCLGIILAEQGRLNEATECYHKVLRLIPDHADAHNNIGTVLKGQGKIDEAINHYHEAMRLKPNHANIHSNMLFTMHYSSAIDPTRIYSEHRNWANKHALPLVDTIQLHSNKINPDRKLRIGYVSPDFRMHSVAFFAEHMLLGHDRADFEIYCYSNVSQPDSITDRFKGLSDFWRNIVGMSDEQVADKIRDDQIDILVDLAGHTANNHMLVFAKKPAPVQVTYLGYPNTTGLPTMDYRITDEWADPIGQTEHLHTEELIRLPKSFLCYKPPENAPEVLSLPALNKDNATFGSFNNRSKITPEVVEDWSTILKSVSDSRLILKAKAFNDDETRQILLEMFIKNGVNPQRIRLIGYLPFEQHLQLYNSIDIGLDTFPYNGTTTTCEAMWMGVPVITLAGDFHASRVGVSILSNVGLSDLIAESTEDYIKKAVTLANNLDRLHDLRIKLRPLMIRSALMDEKGFTRSLEEAYRQMWRRWCDQAQNPSTIQDQQCLVDAFATGLQCHQTGDFLQAEKIYQHILQKNPNQPEVLHQLGLLYYQVGKYDFGVTFIKKAIAQNHSEPLYYNNLGIVLRDKGELDAAIRCYQEAMRLNPDYAAPYLNLGVALQDQNKLDQAIKYFKKALEINPDYAEAYSNISVVLRSQGSFEDAIKYCQKALRLKPGCPDTHHNMGLALGDDGKLDEAIEHFKKALENKPDCAEILESMGVVLALKGKLNEGIKHLEDSLQLNQDCAIAYYHLSVYKKWTDQDIDKIIGMENLLKKNNISREDRIKLSFALGKVYDDLKIYDKAFSYYKSANELKNVEFDIETHTKGITRLIQTFSKDFFKKIKKYGSNSELPIFIVGMPRSGTTLVEQIISSHPQVVGAGELEDFSILANNLQKITGLSTQYPECVFSIGEDHALYLADIYLKRLRELGGDVFRVTDKMPNNFMHLGLISLLFPKARIIHCQRNSLDICLSCYFQDFRGFKPFIYNLTTLGLYYRQYERLMKHWHNVLQLQIMNVNYEELVENQEDISRKIIDFCGLEWNDKCLSFHKNKRSVQTVSTWQVRQPMYTTSKGRWKNYDKFLEPLRKALTG